MAKNEFFVFVWAPPGRPILVGMSFLGPPGRPILVGMTFFAPPRPAHFSRYDSKMFLSNSAGSPRTPPRRRPWVPVGARCRSVAACPFLNEMDVFPLVDQFGTISSRPILVGMEIVGLFPAGQF